MEFEERKNRIRDYINSSEYIPLKRHELAIMLDVPAQDMQHFNDIIDALTAEGSAVETKKGKIMAAEKLNIYPGVFTGNAKDFGFVRVEGMENDIFIPSDATNGAMNKDKVLIKVKENARDGFRAEGEVLKITERGMAEIVGTFDAVKNYGFVIPDDKKIGRDIFIPEGRTKGAVSGHKVAVKITKRASEKANAEGVVTEIIGHINDPGVDILSIIKQFELPGEFPDDVKRQIEKIDPDNIDERLLTGREDYRNVQTVTIDGDDSKDFDDAVSVKRLDNGGYELGVHIADVTEYVTEGSPLDKEALKRATSIYLVDRVIPMLPHKLSNGICSLNPHVDRLALSCIMNINDKGDVVSHKIVKSVINSDRRMTYKIVNDILENENSEFKGEYSDLLDMFSTMLELRNILLAKRKKRGSVNFDLPECEIVLNDRGEPIDIKPHERNMATSIIEEFMLICNETVAEDYFWQELPFVYRNHEAPDEEKIKSLAQFIYNFGYHFKGRLDDEIHPKAIADLLESVSGKPEEHIISRVVLRSMKQAKYMPDNLGHFGLAAKYYCHFTSPIRRYPDLQIHRIIKENIDGKLDEKRIQHYDNILTEVSEQSSKRERLAEEAERETDKLKQVQYMTKHLGETFTGIISGVTGWGIFVELPNTVEGLIALNTLDDDYYVYDEQKMCVTGEHTGKKYSLGDKVKVMADKADVAMRTIDFILCD